MCLFSKLSKWLNPFDVSDIVDTILTESYEIQLQLNDMKKVFKYMETIIEEYEEKLETYEETINDLCVEKGHVLETIIMHLEGSCLLCKEGPVKDTIEYCKEVKKSINNKKEV